MAGARVTLTLPSIDALRDEFGTFAELSLADIARRRQWCWRRLLEVAHEAETLEKEIIELRVERDRAHATALETSYALTPERRVAHHRAVADLAVADLDARLKGKEAELRILSRWNKTLDTLHSGLQSHGKDMRSLGA